MDRQRMTSVQCMPKDAPRFAAFGFELLDRNGPLWVLCRDEDEDGLTPLVALAERDGLEFFGAWTGGGPFPTERFCAAGGAFRCAVADESYATIARINEDGTVDARDLALVADYLDFEHVVEARMKRAAALTEKEQR